MSYADAAASSGPIGAEKLPTPPELETTTDPSGSVGVIDEAEEYSKGTKEKLKKLEGKAKKDYEKGAKKAKKNLKDFEDSVDKESSKLFSFISKNLKYAGNYLSNLGASINANTSNSLAKTSEEFKNPVVIIQALVGLGGLVASYVVYLERAKILSNHKSVIGTHAAIITGLVTLDGYLFQKYYPKYESKSKKL